MKHFNLNPKSGIAIFLYFFSCMLLQAQNNKSFKNKIHKDTLINKSGLAATVINGKGTQNNLGNISSSLSNQLHFSSAASNLRMGGAIEVIRSQESGLPIFISTPKSNSNTRVEVKSDAKIACFDYLHELSSITGIAQAEEQFKIRNIETETNGKCHIRLSQKYKGVKVFGAEVIVHLNSLGQGELFNGTYHTIKHTLNLIPSISTDKAVSSVIADLSAKVKYRELGATQKEILEYNGPTIDTVVYCEKSLVKTYLLAYHISIRPDFVQQWEYFVDANSGRIIESYKNSCHVDGPRTATANDLNGVSRSVNSYQVSTNYYLIDASRSMFDAADSKMPDDPAGAILTLDLLNTFGANQKYSQIKTTNNVWNNPTAISAHYNAGVAYEYYKNVHGRNSIDGKGGTIISFINVVNDEDGTKMDNAYWNGKAMFYGNGNTAFKPLAGGMDVGGHEMTHGVVQNTANLEYKGESGAINESMADIFACMMDSLDWLIGEDVVKISSFPSGALRSLSDPHNGGSSLSDQGYQPKILSEKYNGTQDNGGVHINSGIANYAYYLFATSIGKGKASKIYYKALKDYLTQSSQFIDLRLAVIQSAKDLYGEGSNEQTKAAVAFDAVGILNGTTTTTTSTLPVNPGTEYVLIYDTDETEVNGLFRSNATASDFVPLINKSMYNKPSVTDDGSTAVFVGNNQKIYAINVDPALTPNLRIIQDQTVWANVAISRDGKRFAAIALDKDTSIYVYDFAKALWTRFMLYNPTFTEGVKAAGPIYADGIEWDYSGEYLIYDCFNSINNSSGNDIEYWDINLIKVWDNTVNNFSNGNIFKLFTDLEEGESIGNPSFAKNSPNIIAFDYENDITGEFAVLGYDIEKNDVEAIALNNTLGWPSYSKTDGVLAFTSLDNSGNSDINFVNLNADKISSDGSQFKFTDNAQWPVYFAAGKRNIATAIDAGATQSNLEMKVYPNPVKDELNILLAKEVKGAIYFEFINCLGQSVLSKFINENAEKINVNLDISQIPIGLYYLQIKTDETFQTFKIIKE